MVKFKRVLAVVLSATMVLAGSITAFATETPVGDLTGSGNTNGTGTGEGHVNKKVMSMVLPTNVASVFNYTMDPERLIQATDHARYSDYTFPDEDADTGVYFLVDTKVYANAANKVTVINKGSIDATLTVSIKADDSNSSTDIALLDAAPQSTDTTAGLYLEATIAGKTQAIKANSPDVVVTLPGETDNYKIEYDETDGYTYEMKTEGLKPWKACEIQVTGEVTNGIPVTSATTAPKILATWSFKVAEDTDTPTTGAAATSYSDTPAKSVSPTTVSAASPSFTLSGGTLASIVLNKTDGSTPTLTSEGGKHYTVSGSTVTMKESLLSSNPGATLTVTFEGGGTATVTIAAD